MASFRCSWKCCQLNIENEIENGNECKSEEGSRGALLHGYVEVRASFPQAQTLSSAPPQSSKKETEKNKKSNIDNFKVTWSKNGDAVFHSKCWDQVNEVARKRGAGKSKLNTGKKDDEMTSIERAMVKEAAETAEYHDHVEKVKKEASRIAEMIKRSNHAVVFTGAGISTSAGIGDYRGKTGKWTEEDREAKILEEDSEPAAKKSKKEETGSTSDSDSPAEGVPYEDLRPTYTHEAIVKLMEMNLIKYIISQNGDGLHLLSGVPQEKISELHGNVFLEKCEKCGERYERPYYVMDDLCSQYFEDLEDYGKTEVKKPKHAKKCELCGLSHRTGRKCKKCNGHLMDTIINFRDNLEEEILNRATEEAKTCDLMICLGSTLTVTPACRLVKKGKKPLKVVICNRQETSMDPETPLGSRVFGDCDLLMKEIMIHILSAEELKRWEDGQKERMAQYDKNRKL